MREQIQQKAQMVINHADEAVGYCVGGGLCSTPIWLEQVSAFVEPITAILQFVAVAVGIGVGISTWRLNRAKKKALEKGGKKS